MWTPEAEQYERILGALEGLPFQDEVCALLYRVYFDFQRVPAKPSGDAGLDGLSHNQKHAYLCYGPKQEPFKTRKKSPALKDDILVKFRRDLRHLFELKYDDDKKTLVHEDNDRIEDVLAPGHQIGHIELVVSIFETRELIAPLQESLDEYKAASKCRFVSSAATLRLSGPKDLVALGPVDDFQIIRARQTHTHASIRKALEAGELPPLPASDFDDKFDWLEARRQTKLSVLRKAFRDAWAVALQLELDYAGTLVHVHQGLEQIRTEAGAEAETLRLDSPAVGALLSTIQDRVARELRERFSRELPPDVVVTLARGEVARLIGECPIDWRAP